MKDKILEDNSRVMTSLVEIATILRIILRKDRVCATKKVFLKIVITVTRRPEHLGRNDLLKKTARES